MNPNIDHHLYTHPNPNQSPFSDQISPTDPASHQPLLTPNHHAHQYNPPQNFRDPFAPSAAEHQSHTISQHNPRDQLPYTQHPHYLAENNFPQNNSIAYQPVQQYLQPPPVIVQQTIHVIHHQPPMPKVVSVVDYHQAEDFRMLSGCYNMFKCWLLLFMVCASLSCGLLMIIQLMWGWEQAVIIPLSLLVYLIIFSKIEFDAIADRKLSKAKIATRGYLAYLLYFWIVIAAVTSAYNKDVGTVGTDYLHMFTVPIFTFLIGAVCVERKLVRFETHKEKIRCAVAHGY